MLLSAVIICCIIVANAESSLNSYAFTGDTNNGFDYSNIINNNGYLGSKDNYQNSGSFYDVGNIVNKLSNHVGGHSSLNADNQGGIGSDIGNNYNGYSASDQGNEYSDYSNTYDNADSDSYNTPTRTASTSFKVYSNSNDNGQSAFNAYSSGVVHNKDTDFGQHTINGNNNNGKRIPVYSAYLGQSVLENYPESSVGDAAQGYNHDAPGSSSYSEANHAYASYPQGDSISEYLFGKQKDGLYNPKGGLGKYIYAIPSAMRHTRGNAAHLNHNRDLSLYMANNAPSGHFSKIRVSGAYSTGKSSKYGYKPYSRYAPNNGAASYSSRGRDAYPVPYGKGSGKIIMIKDSRPSYSGHVYSDDPYYAGGNGGYRGKSGSFIAKNFDGYGNSGRSYDDSPTSFKRYKASRPMLLQKSMYP